MALEVAMFATFRVPNGTEDIDESGRKVEKRIGAVPRKGEEVVLAGFIHRVAGVRHHFHGEGDETIHEIEVFLTYGFPVEP